MTLSIDLGANNQLRAVMTYVHIQTAQSSLPQAEIDRHQVPLLLPDPPIVMEQNETDEWKSSILTYPEPHSKSVIVSLRSDPLFSDLQHPDSLDGSAGVIHNNFSDDATLTGELLNASLPGIDLLPASAKTDSSLMLTILLLVTAISALLLVWYPLRSWWQKRNLKSAEDPTSSLSHLPIPPGEFGIPIVGETLAWLKEGPKFNSNRRKKHGNVFKTNIIGEAMVRVSGHEFVEQVLRGEHEKVTTIWPAGVRSILGENVLVNSTGAIHRYKRKITCKAFTNTALDSYIPVLQHHARKNIHALVECERPLMYNKLLRLTFDFAASTLLGFDLEKPEFKKSVETFYTLVSNIICIPIRIPGLGFCKAMNARAQLLDLLEDHIVQKKSQILESLNQEDEQIKHGIEPNIALDIILRETLRDSIKSKKEQDISNNNNNEGDEAVSNFALKEMAMELMFAGYFTSASALTSCVLELARNPEVFRRVEEELLEHGILRKEGDLVQEEEQLSLRKIHGLTYLEQVLKETLRIRPPVLGGYRRALKTFQIGDYRIPKGWAVIYNIRDTHEFEFEDMDKFDPERFAPGQSGNDKFRFLSFGGGPRMCVGREYARLIIKIALIEMFRNYRKWELVNKGLPKMKAIPTLYPVDGLPCNLYPREKVGFVAS